MDIKFNGKALIASLALLSSLSSTLFIKASDIKTSTGSEVIENNLPIGAIVVWGGQTIPDGWAEMNGQTVSSSEVTAIFGGALPDLRGRFVRGHGGNSDAMGVVQLESIKSHNHTASFVGNPLPGHSHSYTSYKGESKDGGSGGHGADNHTTTRTTSSVSGGTPTGSVSISNYGSTETVPNNVAMKYIIKIK